MLFPQSIIIAANRTGIIFKTSLIEIFTNVTASYLLMLKYGIMGVAYGTVIAFLTEKLVLLLFCHRVLKISPQRFLALKTWTMYTVLLIIVYFISLKIRHL
jgi:O-antigen/teichoic acid export membrane protein